MQGKMQRKHVAAYYGIDRNTVNNAIKDGELVFNNNGWINTADVVAWGEKKGHKPPSDPADTGPQSAAGFIPDEAIDRIQDFNVSSETLKKFEDAADASKAFISTIAAREKQVKMMKDIGRLGDLAELQAVSDAAFNHLATAIKKLSNELAAELARKYKLKVDTTSPLLDDVTDYLLKQVEAVMAELESKARAFEDQKAAEVKQRQRSK